MHILATPNPQEYSSAIDERFKILTDRCVLRRVSIDDIPHIFQATRDPNLNKGLGWDAPKNQKALVKPVNDFIAAWHRGDAYTCTILNKHTDGFIGRMGVRKDSVSSHWSVGYWISPVEQGKGYATECATAILNFAFQQLSALVISASHAYWNDASKRVIEKLGFEYKRRKKFGFKKNGKFVEELEYDITRSRWLALRKQADLMGEVQ